MPIEATLYGTREESKKIKEEEKEIKKREWKEETKEEHLRRCEAWTSSKEKIEEIWMEIKVKVKEAIPKSKKRRHKWKMGERIRKKE